MPGGPRALPDQPNLRFLKLEAKRRHANGEFAALHDAQLAIAREHGLASWAELKKVIEPDSRAVDQLRWIIQRFRGAGEPGWTAPGEQELREHFEERFLAAVPGLVRELTSASDVLNAELEVQLADLFEARAELGGLLVTMAVEPAPPYRVTGLLVIPAGKPVADDRIAGAAPARSSGGLPAPAGLTELAGRLTTELGVPALAFAGGFPGDDPAGQGPAGWVVTRGWADLDRAEPVTAEHRFAAPGISLVVTAIAVLRLVADGRCALDDPANLRLRTLRLADDAITVRDLLSNTSGLTDPAQLIGDVVPDLITLLGPVAACDGRRGVFRPSNAGAGVLGQIVEDITGAPYADAMTTLVLAPLGMRASRFPASAADIGGGTVTGYAVTRDAATSQDILEPAAAAVCTIQAAGGLWSTPADIVRLGTGWASLLPAGLAREALTLQLPAPEDNQPPGGVVPGLGWLIDTRGDRTAMIAGALPGATAELVIRLRDNRAFVILTSRLMSLNDIDRQAGPLWFS
jgi:CubicO group peptidase (beta-lactamase class C family)